MKRCACECQSKKKTTAPNNLATIRVLQKHFILPAMLSEGDVGGGGGGGEGGGGGGEGGEGQPEIKHQYALSISVTHSCIVPGSSA